MSAIRGLIKAGRALERAFPLDAVAVFHLRRALDAAEAELGRIREATDDDSEEMAMLRAQLAARDQADAELRQAWDQWLAVKGGG